MRNNYLRYNATENMHEKQLESYHRRLRMISEAGIEGGQVSHSCCMCVVGHGYGG